LLAPVPPRCAQCPARSPEVTPIATILTYAEYAVLILAAGLALRLATKPPFRRDAAEHRALAFGLGVAGALAGLAIAWAVATWPLARHAATALALVAMAALAWRARPSYGASRRWPPGSLGLGASLDAIGDRSFYRDQAARHGPVFKMSQFGRPVACVVGHERGRLILSEHASSLAPATLPYNRLLAKGLLRYMSGADHRDEAPAFRAAFAKMELAGAEDAVRASLRRELDALVEGSAARGDGVDARVAFNRWMVAAIGRVFLGLDPRDPRVDAIRALLPDIATHRQGGPAWRRALVDALARFAAIARDVDRERRAGSPVIAPGTALALLVEADAQSLERPARIENFALIYRIASSDLTGLSDWIFQFATEHPDALEPVRAHGRSPGGPRQEAPVDPATAFVMETLRLEQSEFLYRRVVAPIEIDGRVIPAGWILRLCVNEAHRDPVVFPDPDRFDPRRFLARSYTRNEYSPFGGHTHGCMGAHLAHFLGRILVEELALGYDWTVVRDGPLERGSRHRDHWRPSSLRRVAMRARTEEPVSA